MNVEWCWTLFLYSSCYAGLPSFSAALPCFYSPKPVNCSWLQGPHWSSPGCFSKPAVHFLLLGASHLVPWWSHWFQPLHGTSDTEAGHGTVQHWVGMFCFPDVFVQPGNQRQQKFEWNNVLHLVSGPSGVWSCYWACISGKHKVIADPEKKKNIQNHIKTMTPTICHGEKLIDICEARLLKVSKENPEKLQQ